MNPPILTCPEHGIARSLRPGQQSYYCRLCRRDYRRKNRTRVLAWKRTARLRKKEREQRGETPYVLALKAEITRRRGLDLTTGRARRR